MRGEGERVALSRRTPRTAPRPDRPLSRAALAVHTQLDCTMSAHRFVQLTAN